MIPGPFSGDGIKEEQTSCYANAIAGGIVAAEGFGKLSSDQYQKLSFYVGDKIEQYNLDNPDNMILEAGEPLSFEDLTQIGVGIDAQVIAGYQELLETS